ncbi:DUF4255 domain-containing protein [Actinokineospora globicatena]|nr:DUF4255 domain-containing protein [Actinokineospora globicatena]
MIHEVDDALRGLLTEGGVPGSGGELAFEAPTTDWTARRTVPTVNVFLYDIREDRARRSTGTTEELDAHGKVTGWRDPPRWFRLSYLVTAWTNRPQDEHRLLSRALSCLVRRERVEDRWLTGSLAELGLSVTMEAAGPVSQGSAATDIWSALGGELKPAIDVLVIAPLIGAHTPAGPPVTEGLVLRGDLAPDPGHHLRYETPTTAEGDGFAPTRPRPTRRKRSNPIR